MFGYWSDPPRFHDFYSQNSKVIFAGSIFEGSDLLVDSDALGNFFEKTFKRQKNLKKYDRVLYLLYILDTTISVWGLLVKMSIQT